LQAFQQMGVVTSCTCTPYLSGNVPHFGEHIAWAESSAVAYANSVIGARTNREGGPSALAAALTGFTPEYGLHLTENRQPGLTFQVNSPIQGSSEFGALGKVIGEYLESQRKRAVPYIAGIETASLEELKSFCASIATYGGVALFHMQSITPEAMHFDCPPDVVSISRQDIDRAAQSMEDSSDDDIDFVSLGCPHLSIQEIRYLADLLQGRHVKREFWITTSRAVKRIADSMGYTQIIEGSGAKFAADTCCVVAPIKGRFQVMATDSAKACYYAFSKNRMKTRFLPFDQVVELAVNPSPTRQWKGEPV